LPPRSSSSFQRYECEITRPASGLGNPAIARHIPGLCYFSSTCRAN
jgi:hypothetical protein